MISNTSITFPVSTRVSSEMKNALLRLASERRATLAEVLYQLAANAVLNEGKGFSEMVESATESRAIRAKLAETESLLAAERAAHRNTALAAIEMRAEHGYIGSGIMDRRRKKFLSEWEEGKLVFVPNPKKWD